MHTMRRLIVFTAAISFGVPLIGQTLAERIIQTDTLFIAPASDVLANVALAPMRSSVSMSHAAVGFERASMSESLWYPLGRGSASGSFDAAAYIKTSRATICGHAEYRNGRRYGVNYCMVSDPELLFPYFTAVDASGDFKNETYTFGGSYSSDFNDGQWIYGVSLDYRALQEYRDADPRPKNTVGQLSFAGGFGGRFGSYYIALGLDAFKYRQSNNIMFVSEQGELPVYHLSGMTSHYVRFAGTGKSAYYSGWSRGVSLDLYPVSQGAYASGAIHRFTFTKTLKDLNNLPVNDLTNDSYALSAGWLASVWSALTFIRFERRIGTENIFGDPSGNVYPELFSLSTYGWRRTSGGVAGAWHHISETLRVDAYASAAYLFTEEVYKGTLPRLRGVSKEWMLNAEAQIIKVIDGKISTEASIKASALTSCRYSAGARIGADYMISGDKSLGLSLGCDYRTGRGHNQGYAFVSALTFKF